MVIPNVNIWIWNHDIPCLNFCDLDILYLSFMISRQIFVLGISQHKSRYPEDILSYVGTTIFMPWISFLVSSNSFLASLGHSCLYSIAPPCDPTTPNPSCITATCHTSVSDIDRPPTRGLPLPKHHNHWVT